VVPVIILVLLPTDRVLFCEHCAQSNRSIEGQFKQCLIGFHNVERFAFLDSRGVESHTPCNARRHEQMSPFNSSAGSHAGSQHGSPIHRGDHTLRESATYVPTASPLCRAAMSPAPGSHGPLQASKPSSASVGSRRRKPIKMFGSGLHRAT
jgi:hypothetical protein